MPKIFISYRRADSQDYVAKLDDALVARFSRDKVFRDVASEEYGEHYLTRIDQEIVECAVQLVVIGPQWLTVKDEQGKRRLDDPNDIVIRELTFGKQHGVRQIPLVVGGADFPKGDAVPPSIKEVIEGHGEALKDATFAHDLHKVIDYVARYIDEQDFVERVRGEVVALAGPVCPVQAASITLGSKTYPLAPYAIGRYPITVKEYALFLAATKHQEPPAMGSVFWSSQLRDPRHPVVNVSWHDAVAYAAWLAEMTGQHWRLPTEAEWEYAARGKEGRLYPWGDHFAPNRCNTAASHAHEPTDVGKFVRQHDASPCGAEDMAGNVWEWTLSLSKDYDDAAYLVDAPPENPGNRSLRGGSWADDESFAQTTCRGADSPSISKPTIGFRLVIGA